MSSSVGPPRRPTAVVHRQVFDAWDQLSLRQDETALGADQFGRKFWFAAKLGIEPKFLLPSRGALVGVLPTAGEAARP